MSMIVFSLLRINKSKRDSDKENNKEIWCIKIKDVISYPNIIITHMTLAIIGSRIPQGQVTDR